MGAAGNYQQNLAVVIKPVAYFDNDITGFDSVTLTLTLTPNCYQCKQYTSGDPITLAGADGSDTMVVNLGPVDNGGLGALIVVPITFVTTASTSRGFYMLFLSAQATAADGTVFMGWDQIPVAVNAFWQ
jgi:hypothetical protein